MEEEEEIADEVALLIDRNDVPYTRSYTKTHQIMNKTRSFPDLFDLESDLVHGSADWATDKLELRDERRMEILARFDPPQSQLVDVLSRRDRAVHSRAWRGANLRKIREKRKMLTRKTSGTSPGSISNYDLIRRKPKKPWWHPSRGGYRWLVLVFAVIMTFGDWVFFDSVGALSVGLEGPPYNLDINQLGLLDGLYTIPNTVLVALGGVLIDKFGIRKVSMMFALLVFLGNLMFAGGVYSNTFWLMALARVIFGLGGDCFMVAQDCFIASWFSGRHLAFAMSMSTVVARGADIFAFAGLPPIALLIGVAPTFWMVAGISLFCFLCCVVAMTLDKVAEVYAEGWEETEGESFSIKDIQNFGLAYWLATAIVVLFYGSVLPFQQFAETILLDQYAINGADAGLYTSILSAASLIMSPILGFLCDRYGFRVHACLAACGCLIMAFVLMIFPSVSVIAPLVLIGVAFSLVPAALWPCLAIIVPPNRFGTAYGLMECGINILNTALYYGMAPLLRSRNVFAAVMIWLALAVSSMILCVWWLIVDKRTGNLCRLPSVLTVAKHSYETADSE